MMKEKNKITPFIKTLVNQCTVRFLQVFLMRVKLEEEQQIDFKLNKKRLDVSPIEKPKYHLDDLLSQISPETIPEEVYFGEPMGKEMI